jgi:hypothetical protein
MQARMDLPGTKKEDGSTKKERNGDYHSEGARRAAHVS